MAQLPNLLQGPEPVETAELHFKLCCKLKIFESQTKYEGGHCCVVAASQYYGLIFAGNCNGFSVIKTKSLGPAVDSEKFPKREITLNLRPTHLSVDFSQKILAVVCSSKPGSVLIFYDIQTFASKDVAPLKVTPIAKLSQNLAAEVVDLTWQPNADGSLMICMSDGSVLALTQGAKDGPIFTLPNTTQAICFCWSPKGKQIVVGTASGTLSQYKPDLKLVKTLPPPPLFNGAAMVVSILWISSYQFAAAYNDRTNLQSFPVITIVNAAKNEPVSVINFDDVTYSSTLFRNHQIYMTHHSAWNLIFVSSANSIEVAVLGSKDGSSWEQWLLGDASRAELPLNPDRQETFPLGWAFDFTSQETIPWGEGMLRPMPRLLLMSDEGVLCVFNIVNSSSNAPQVCAAPKENLDDSLFVSMDRTPLLPASEPPKTSEAPKTVVGPPLNFGNSKTNFPLKNTFGGFETAKPQTMIPQGAPTVFQQQQETQPQPQPQVQQPAQQTLVLLTQPAPSTTTFKLSTAHFGTPPTFSFGTSAAATTLGVRPTVASQQVASQQMAKTTTAIATATSTATATKFGAPQTVSLTLKPSTVPGDIFVGKPPPQSTPKKQGEVEKPVTAPAPPSKLPEEVVVDASAQGESPRADSPELAAVDDSVYLSAVEEEIEHFSSELQQLSAKVGNLNIHVGTEEDKEKMKKSIDGLYDFWKELKETTKGQSSEIHTVVMDLMEAFAWLEDAKARNLQRKNPSYMELKKSEELDPLSARHVSEIGHLKYYIENQLKQLTSYLEKDWIDHQENYRNEVKGRMAVPPLEEVYITMHFQLKILHKQKILLEELKEKMVTKKRKNKPKSFLILTNNAAPARQTGNNRASELSKLAENLLQLKINKEESSPRTGMWEMIRGQLNATSEMSRKLTREKQSALREALSECDALKIRPVKTTLESSAFLRTLALEKVAKKMPKAQATCKESKEKGVALKASETKIVDVPKLKPESKPKVEKEKTEEKPMGVMKHEPAEKVEKPQIPLTVQSLAEKEEKSPLASLSGIVSSIGKKNEMKPQQTFVFGSSTFSKLDQGKEPIVFGSANLDLRQEKPKVTPTFTFGAPKPGEAVFGSKEPSLLSTKPVFGLTSVATAKPDLSKTSSEPNVTITPVTTTPATTASFTFSAVTTSASSLVHPMNLLFSGKDQSTRSIFSIPSTAPQTSSSILFGTGLPIFGGSNKTSTLTTSVSLFGGSKTTSDTSSQPSGFSFGQSTDSKPTITATLATAVKPTSETEDVDVVKVDEPAKKPETPLEKPKNPPKVTIASSIFGSSLTMTKTVTETPTTSTPSTFSFVTASQNSENVSAKAVTTTAASGTATTTTETPPATSITPSTTVTATTSSSFSFSKVTTPVAIGQTATTTSTTTAASSFGTPKATASMFGQVSSTTPTTNIFGGSATTTPTTNIFGGSTPTTTAAFGAATPNKSVFGQAATATTTTENLFGTTTPTTNTFGQTTTPTTPVTFGQKPDTVSQTTSLFGQLLSDGNRHTAFGTSTGTGTTGTNIFSTPNFPVKMFTPNIFGGGGGDGSASTTTASLFGSNTSSIFPLTTSVFGSGQSTTSTSIFGQSQTSPSNTFFGQNICSPFGGGETSVTSNQSTFESGGFSKPTFGQSVFGGQTTNNTSIFGGSSNASLFGGTSSTTSSNVFQTATTSTTFGSTAPGPFTGGASTFGENSFGSPSSSFQKPLGGFGSPPVFGGGPAFGGSPTFGGSPSFGSMPTFGSLSQGSVGQSSSGSTTFENLANQNTLGFRNLAQQSQNQSFGGGRFGSPSFENKPPAFGGNSFSSWRSSNLK